MEAYPKFIIETDDDNEDYIVIAKCTYHYQIVNNKEKVKGGGWWSLDNEKTTFTLFGTSHDFGDVNIEDIAKCIQNKKVFSSKSLLRNLSNEFKFKYKNSYGEIIDLETYKI